MAEKWADRADLHTHTTASDGTLSPRQLVALAGELGLGAVAITDHDTVAGLAEGLAAGEELGVRVVPGVELSTSQAGCEVHIVGLFIRPDSPALLDFLTRQREERVGLYAGAFDLTKDLGSAVASYSHGMKQKLAIISALIRKPKLLVLDEPFVGLDPAASHLLKGYLRELCGAGGAVFFSTHVLEVAEKMCDTIAIIKDGQLVRYGPTEEVVGDSSLEDVFLGMAEKGAEA